MTDREALQAARDLLAQPGVWCQSAQARYTDKWGKENTCSALSKAATRWCAAGALVKVTRKEQDPPGLRALQAASKDLFQEDLGRYNDNRGTTLTQILYLFDAALRSEAP